MGREGYYEILLVDEWDNVSKLSVETGAFLGRVKVNSGLVYILGEVCSEIK